MRSHDIASEAFMNAATANLRVLYEPIEESFLLKEDKPRLPLVRESYSLATEVEITELERVEVNLENPRLN